MGSAHVTNLTEKSEIYTANAWLYACDEGGEGCLSLIDTGCDPRILFQLRDLWRKTGSRPLDQILLTHGHYDHAKMVRPIVEEFPVPVYGWSSYTPGIDHVFADHQEIRAGPDTLEIIHVPGHTTDSVVIYSRNEGFLFSGDSPIFIWGTDGTYEPMFVHAFETIMDLDVTTIYPGHGEPVTEDVRSVLESSYRNLKRSRII